MEIKVAPQEPQGPKGRPQCWAKMMEESRKNQLSQPKPKRVRADPAGSKTHKQRAQQQDIRQAFRAGQREEKRQRGRSGVTETREGAEPEQREEAFRGGKRKMDPQDSRGAQPRSQETCKSGVVDPGHTTAVCSDDRNSLEPSSAFTIGNRGRKGTTGSEIFSSQRVDSK